MKQQTTIIDTRVDARLPHSECQTTDEHRENSMKESRGASSHPGQQAPTPVVYRFDGDTDGRITGYADYARLIDGISTILFQKYGVAYELYASNDPNMEYWNLLEEDVCKNNPEVEHVARIYDRLEERTLKYDDEGEMPDYGVHLSIHNNVFAYPEWGVALARVPFFREHGIYKEDFVFSIGDQQLLDFLSNVRARERRQNMNRVTVFTDTTHGINRKSEPVTRAVSREEVIMDPAIKQEIFRSLDQFFEADRTFYRTYNIPYKRGILLYGRPGNGKTTLVKSIAGTVNGPVAYWQITEHTDSGSIKEVFEAASRLAPMVLVIEDIDSMPQHSRSFFLNTLDGATSKEGIFLIGTTNYPEKIDPGLMNRAGRFDRAYEVALPDEELRRKFMELRGIGAFVATEEVQKAAKLADGLSLAQLGELYVTAALEWHEQGQTDLLRIIQGIKGELDKERKQDWMARPDDHRMGFF